MKLLHLVVQFEVILFKEIFGNQMKMKPYNVIMNQTMIQSSTYR